MARGGGLEAEGWAGRCGGAEGNRDRKAYHFCKVQGTSGTAKEACYHPPSSQSCSFYAEIKNENDFSSLESGFLWAHLDEDISTTQTLIEVFGFAFVCGINLCDTIKIHFICTIRTWNWSRWLKQPNSLFWNFEFDKSIMILWQDILVKCFWN